MFFEMTTTITHRISLNDDGIESVKHAAEFDGGDYGSSLGMLACLIIAEAGSLSAARAFSVEKAKAQGDVRE